MLYHFFFAHVQSMEKFANDIQSGTAATINSSPKNLAALPAPTALPIVVKPPAALPAAGKAPLTASAAIQDNGDQARHHFKTSAGLSDAEESLIKTTAAKCLADLSAYDQTGFAAVKAIAKKYPPDVKLSPQDQAQVDKLEKAREKIVTDYVAQLKSGLGPQRFAVLHSFVVGSEIVRIRHRDLPNRRTK